LDIQIPGNTQLTQAPNDADGDAIRRLQSQNMDLTAPYWIDFNVDFDSWPPAPQALERLRKTYPKGKVEVWDDEELHSVIVQLFDPVTYEFVVRIQAEISSLMAPFGGRCEAWGVLT
jgi:hypothetical protein